MHKSREWLDYQQQQEQLYPCVNNKPFKIKLKKKYFDIEFLDIKNKKNDIIYFGNDYGKIVRLPRNKKRHKFLHFITFGLYKLNDTYRIKLIKNEL